ncbi:glycosyltransferase family 2 protein [Luteibacter sp. SG786]|uniref:glycosyltransferase family 2 protein n=1 Tax=Luteibacter sp. SG786 TaxID=2587130 RepID=UPI0014244566|nr:glycosyltransferase family 2 protein [Luteibacter sp. SG786]NII56407.1 glycosyltransferase involved in cell wall biosynthesis [Luteibacter sp. SG786]
MHTATPSHGQDVAVLIPCFNEELAIASVVRDFRAALPHARIHVFDNASTDRTAEIARDAGAIVRTVGLRGKGNVVRRMFADVDADVYVLVDGDATYDATSAPAMIMRLLHDGSDMLVGVRKDDNLAGAYRSGHRLGNRMLTSCVAMIFGGAFTDMLSGYRVFTRRYVKSFPALSVGFETETELTVHALELRMPWSEMDTPYSTRPEGSESKLSTYKDGLRILRMILRLFVAERPLQFFGLVGALSLSIGVAIAVPLLTTYLATHEVPRLPTAMLSTGLALIAAISVVCGVIMDAVTRARREMKRLFYLGIPGPSIARDP